MIRTTTLAVLLAASFSAFAAEQAKAKVDLTKAKEIAEGMCVACHGADGNSPAPANPILAGQIPEYLYKQLSNFKAVDGKPAVRNNAIMGGMVAALSDEDMKSLSVYFSQQKMKPSAAKEEKLLAEGKTLWRGETSRKASRPVPVATVRPALDCRRNIRGCPGSMQSITANQLKIFRSHERANDAEKVMRTIAGKLSDRQIDAIAEYAAGLR